MKRKRSFSLLALFAMAVAMVASLVPAGETMAADLVDLSDTMSRLEVGQASTHEIEFTADVLADLDGSDVVTVSVTFPIGVTGFDDALVDASSFSISSDNASCTWGSITYVSGVMEVSSGEDSCAAGVTQFTVDVTDDMVNPAGPDEYEIEVVVESALIYSQGVVSLSIVDDDTVNVTGYIDTILTFDIDTAVTDVDCDAAGTAGPDDPCNSHGGAADAAGYVVSLGEMTLSSVSVSGLEALHADGLTGDINYIWFDLSTNANGGAVVTVNSLYGSLTKDIGVNEIPSVARDNSYAIAAGSSLYGLRMVGWSVTEPLTDGALAAHAYCGVAGEYCGVEAGVPHEIYNTTGAPVVGSRSQWAVAATPDAANATGTYTDQLTFIATGTF